MASSARRRAPRRRRPPRRCAPGRGSPSGSTTSGPKQLHHTSKPGVPGATASRANTSASKTTAPVRRACARDRALAGADASGEADEEHGPAPARYSARPSRRFRSSRMASSETSSSAAGVSAAAGSSVTASAASASARRRPARPRWRRPRRAPPGCLDRFDASRAPRPQRVGLGRGHRRLGSVSTTSTDLGSGLGDRGRRLVGARRRRPQPRRPRCRRGSGSSTTSRPRLAARLGLGLDLRLAHRRCAHLAHREADAPPRHVDVDDLHADLVADRQHRLGRVDVLVRELGDVHEALDALAPTRTNAPNGTSFVTWPSMTSPACVLALELLPGILLRGLQRQRHALALEVDVEHLDLDLLADRSRPRWDGRRASSDSSETCTRPSTPPEVDERAEVHDAS